MAPRVAPTKKQTAAAPDAPTNGTAPPPERDPSDFDGFIERARADAASLMPFAWVAEAGADGRTFGSRLGKVPLLPLEDLDERIRAEWPGPRVLVLRTKRANGGAIAHTGRLALAGPPAANPTVPADASMATVVLALQKQVADLTAALAAQRPPAAPAAPALSDQVGALASVAQVLRTLSPAEGARAAGMTIDDVQKLLDLGKRAAGDTSLAIEALRQLGPPVGNVLQATAALLAAKATGGTDK